MLKPLAGCLGAIALLTATFVHVPAAAPAPGRDGATPVRGVDDFATTDTTVSVAAAHRPAARLRVEAPRRAKTGTRVTIRGTAPTHRTGRPVVLSIKRADIWKRVATARATRSGAFRLAVKVPAKAGRTTWKVDARRFGRYRSQSARFTITVTAHQPGGQDPADNPTTSAAGAASDWTYISAGKSMRWDSCSPIKWHYAPDQQAYGTAETDVTRAIAMLADRTGLTFTRVPDKAQADLTIGWATPQQEPMLKGSTVGVGGPAYQSIDPSRNHGTQALIVSGEVTLDATETARPGFVAADGWTWGQVVLHEVMHALGLGHARGDKQVMYPMASTRNQSFGAGDLNGLRMVGAEKGCIDTGSALVPAPRTRTAFVAE